MYCQYSESVRRMKQLATRINMKHYKNVNFIHIYFCDATDSPIERIAGSFFEHKPLQLRY